MIHLKNESFNDLISKGVVLVDFYAEWCGPCKVLSPILEEIENEVKIIKVDVDEHREISSHYRIMNVPTLIFFKDGKEVRKEIGIHSKEELLDIIKVVTNNN